MKRRTFLKTLLSIGASAALSRLPAPSFAELEPGSRLPEFKDEWITVSRPGWPTFRVSTAVDHRETLLLREKLKYYRDPERIAAAEEEPYFHWPGKPRVIPRLDWR